MGSRAGRSQSCHLHSQQPQVSDNVLSVGGKELRIDGKLIVIGAGKAASRMAQVVEEMLGDRITGGLVVTKYGHGIAAAADSPG